MDKTFYTEENPMRFPYAANYEGFYGGFCKLTLSDGTVVKLKGNGTLRYNDIVLYKSLATEIEVGTKCTSIEGGFYSFEELTKITIPSSVTSIILLTAPSITAGCGKLKEINFDGSCPLPTGIAGSYGSGNVDKIIIGPHVTGIAASACSYAMHLTSITIPGSVKYIGQGAFSNCNELTYVNILNGCITIDKDAFYSCPNLASVTIPDSVISVGEDSFFNTPFINDLPDGVIYLGKCLYQYKGTVPLNTEIVIKNGTASISSFAFSSRYNLTSVIIPNSVTSIGDQAFSGCSGLTSLNIPNSVTSIGGGAFSGCYNLTSIEVESGNTKYDSRNNCNAIIESLTNTLVCGCQNTTIPNSVTSIGVRAFFNCNHMTFVNIPNSVTSIGNSAFANCASLISVSIPDSVTSIDSAAFTYCTNLTSITIPNSVTRISSDTFSYCSKLTSVTIPSSVTSISAAAFRSCNSLTSITSLATTSPTIMGNTFRQVKSNGTLTVPVGSTGYENWMGTTQYYLGYYGWTKVEQ